MKKAASGLWTLVGALIAFGIAVQIVWAMVAPYILWIALGFVSVVFAAILIRVMPWIINRLKGGGHLEP